MELDGTRQMEAATRLAETLQSGRLALTADCVPPRGADGEVIKKLAVSFPSALDAVVVADNHEEISASALACSSILAAEGTEPVLTILTRDRNRIALQSDVLGAAMLGVANVLCLSGDHQSLGVCPEAAGAFDIDSIQLVQALTMMRDEGVLLDNKPLLSRPVLFVGAAAHPYLRPLELALIGLRKKVEVGAQFLITQPVFDVPGLAEWMSAVREAGLHERTHIIASVRPLLDTEQAEDLRTRQRATAIPDDVITRLRESNDPVREGITICAEIAVQVKEIEGVRGIHILCGGSGAAAAEVIQQARLSRS
jgi:methylenetetrahydrofolate reductase (NADPH)